MHTKLEIKVVNKNLGDIPNSIWNSDVKQSGFDNLDFLVHLNYKGEYSFHDINDVKNNPNDTFYFPYYCSLMHFSDLYDKKENKNLLKLVDLLKQKNVKILFFEPHEVYSDFQLQKLSDFIDFFKIEKNRFFYITNDIQIEDKSKNLNFIGKKYNHLWINTSNGYIEDTRDINFKTEREFVFLNKNKKAKPHRLIILAILQKYNLLHISNYSFLRGIQKEFDLDELVFGGSNKLDIDLEVMYSKHGGMPQEFVESPYLNHLQKNILNISNWPLVKTKYEKSSDMVSHLKNGSNFAGMLQVKDYEESYINITSETQYIENYVHISEKSLKPLNSLYGKFTIHLNILVVLIFAWVFLNRCRVKYSNVVNLSLPAPLLIKLSIIPSFNAIAAPFDEQLLNKNLLPTVVVTESGVGLK